MKPILRILLLLPVLAQFLTLSSLAAIVQEIERLPFDDAYRQWLEAKTNSLPTYQKIETLHLSEADRRQLKEKLATLPEERQGLVYVVNDVWGSTDPHTGIFTPSVLYALTCRLGRDAHLHETFLLQELRTNIGVSMIFDASPRLCSRYGVKSEAPVVFDPEHGYSPRPRSWGSGQDERRRVWLQATTKAISQQDGAANESQPAPAKTNSTPSAAGSRR